MDGRLPLPALLSQALIAFTIEFDNEFEHRMPHRTTNHPATGPSAGPWLVSMVMWMNCMRFVSAEGVHAETLEELARTKTNLNGMERWGYITVTPDLIRATPKGRQAQEVWRPLPQVIEKRWQDRFGANEIQQLRESLSAIARQIDLELPDCLPILGYGLYSRDPDRDRPAGRSADENLPSLSLPALLSRVLLSFAIEYERESEVSLAIGANVLRLVPPEGVRVRDLPRLAGVSKEGIATAVSFLEKRKYVIVRPVKVLTLTPAGSRAQDVYHHLAEAIEARWKQSFGKDVISTLQNQLQQLVVGQTPSSPLFRGLDPYPDNWRASIPRPLALPHYPMVLHRGGFPDGS
jgi:hypothetical protein